MREPDQDYQNKHYKEENTAEIVKKAAVRTAVTIGLGGAIAAIRAFFIFGGGQ